MDSERGVTQLDAIAAKAPRLVDPTDLGAEIQELWTKGMPPGDATGWPSLDAHYTVMPGLMTVITGWPGAGKSEFLDALLINLARQGWKHAVFSAENLPIEIHVVKLLEKIIGKPFGDGPSERITVEEVDEFTARLARVFRFMHAPSGGITVQGILDLAMEFLSTFKPGTKRALVIDPWNELEHWRPQGYSETEYISHALSTVRNWARDNWVHMFVVAHPQKIKREDGKLPVPRPDMISGSQHWWNKADQALTVYRDPEARNTQEVEIHIQKIRFKHIGRIGMVPLNYDRLTGRYRETVRLEVVEKKPHWVDL